jgi:hypothetical protein
VSRKHDEAKAARRAQRQRPPLIPSAPQRHRDDGSPVAGEGQVYVTRTGKRYHSQWCGVMAAQWRDRPGTVFLVALGDVGERELCPQCYHHPDSGNLKRPLIKGEATRLREDGSPIAGEGQVYVTRSGRQYHTQWCPSIEGRWRTSPDRVFVSARADAGERTVCPRCEHDPDTGSPQRPLIKVETTNLRKDGSPIAGEGQAYVTRKGKRYHVKWCSIMAAHWRDNPGRVFVSALADVGGRTSCPNCEETGQQPTSARAEWRRLNSELDRLGRVIARILVAKGPEGVNELGPHVIRFRKTEAELNKLSLRVNGGLRISDKAPDS